MVSRLPGIPGIALAHVGPTSVLTAAPVRLELITGVKASSGKFSSGKARIEGAGTAAADALEMPRDKRDVSQ